jgi:titin
VLGNYIGLNSTGAAAVANQGGGVGIYSGAANNTVGGTAVGAGNVISGNVAQGVAIYGVGSNGNTVAGNFIGTNPAGSAAIPNTYSGVSVDGGATGNTVGGSVAGSLNLISGNANQGVIIYSTGTNGNFVQGNWIGINAAGTAALANGYSGVQIGGGAQNNLVGGTTAMTRNVISGNTLQGVYLSGTGTSANRISGNYIGTNAAGTAALGNKSPGVDVVSNATANVIGGTAPGAGNVITANSYRQISLFDAGTTGNVIAGNFIGLNAAGLAALPATLNPGPGIQILAGAHDNTIGGTIGGRNFICGSTGSGITISGLGTNANVIVGNSIGVTPTGTIVANSTEGIALFDGGGSPQGNFIGGTTPGSANLISGNGTAGVAVYNNGTTGNRISGNSFVANGGLGIDLWGDGATANDAGDGDSGPANLQNYPVLTSAVLGTSTVISGSLNSTASTTFRIEFFANATGDVSNFGEGQNFLGAANVTTNGSGNATIAATLNAIVPAGQKVCATAIDPSGNTSEFSQNVTVTTTDSEPDGLPDAYELANWPAIGTTTGSADSDGDGFTNAQEFRAGTNPRNSTSLPLLGAPATVGSDKTLSLPTLTGRTYRVEYTDALLAPTTWRLLSDQIPGTGSTLTITDPGAATLPQRFYRALVVP